MWKFSSGGLVTIVIVAVWLAKQCEAFHPAAAADYLADYENDFSQLNARLRDTLRYIEKLKSHPRTTGLSGQLNSRPARNDVVGETDHALRMHQLHELNRMFAAKARPRFGKRTEVTLDTSGQYVPTSYGGFEDSVYRVLGSSEERR